MSLFSYRGRKANIREQPVLSGRSMLWESWNSYCISRELVTQAITLLQHCQHCKNANIWLCSSFFHHCFFLIDSSPCDSFYNKYKYVRLCLITNRFRWHYRMRNRICFKMDVKWIKNYSRAWIIITLSRNNIE